MGIGDRIRSWPVLRQLSGDPLALGAAAQSPTSSTLMPRTVRADKVVQSICPYCGVGCGQRIFVRDGEIIQIEGDPHSPISRGHLCPKGAASQQLVQSPARVHRVKYRRPYATDWDELPLEQAMDMIAERVIRTRRETWQDVDEAGSRVRRTLGIGSLGGATLDNEENYLIKKLLTALGVVQVENQARI